jgi:UDP-N-acetylmuramate dehydrogenase
MSFGDELRSAFGREAVRDQAPLAPLTTFRVGGPAQWLVALHRADDLVRALQMAHAAGVPVTLLGGGSNVLVGDRGVRGLVIRIRGGGIRGLGPGAVRADGGVTINGLVRWTIYNGLAGLEAWAGTPGTVGGGVAGNAHFDGRLLGERVERVGLASPEGRRREVSQEEMEFGYDTSRLKRTGEVLLWADFRVGRGDPATLRETARRSLAYRKGTQPLALPSAGCAFQNPAPETDRLPEGTPYSAGALIDAAGLKGHASGGARISPVHANFIVNDAGATARDVLELIELCRERVRERFGVELREEIVRLGDFD